MKGLCILIVFALCGCAGKLDRAELKQWVEDPAHGWAMTQVQGALKYTCQYKPLVYVVMDARKWSWAHLTQATLDSVSARYEGNLYFSFRVDNLAGKQDPLHYAAKDSVDYQRKLEYLFANVRRDFALVQGTDTLQPVACDLVPSYNMRPYQVFHLVFRRPRDLSRTFTFCYRDKIFSRREFRFEYIPAHMQPVPEVSL
ncbi:MAG: hypothetical protein KF690_02115 [Bacteroidetes bacterium]|nr:hypothetical protein [Bacteroidota bacterium]